MYYSKGLYSNYTEFFGYETCDKLVWTDGLMDGHISSDWTPLGSSVTQCAESSLQLWTPTLIIVIVIAIISSIITIEYKYKHRKMRMDKRTDKQIYYTATQGIWTCGLWPHALRVITGRTFWSPKIDRNNHEEKQIDRQTCRHIRSTGAHMGPL